MQSQRNGLRAVRVSESSIHERELIMKLCEICAAEIWTKDGENRCETCENEARSAAKKAKRKEQRKAREEALRSLD